MNKRTFQRRVAKQKDYYKKRVFDKCREEMPRSENIEAKVCESSVMCENDSLTEDESELLLNYKFPENSKFSEKLKTWYIDTKPTKMCVEKLLAILKEEGLDVPLCLETLLGRQNIALTKHVSPGVYCHFGIEKQILKIGTLLQSYDEIVIDINIDGIPLFKSSSVQLWPI